VILVETEIELQPEVGLVQRLLEIGKSVPCMVRVTGLPFTRKRSRQAVFRSLNSPGGMCDDPAFVVERPLPTL
jgi:hypothetical protein